MVSSAEGVGSLRIPNGCKCVSSMTQNFDYYSPVAVESAQKSFFEQKVTPVNGVSSDPYEFVFEPVADTYLSLNNMYMHVKARILKADGTKPAKTANVAPVNNLLNSMWSSVETRINNISISPASAYNTSYKSMMETILSTENENHNYMTSSMFELDTASQFDTLGNANVGFKKRKATMRLDQEASVFDMCGPICNDFLRSDNHLAPGNKLSLRFNRASDKFCLLTDSTTVEYKLHIDEIAIYARRITVFPEVSKMLFKPGAPQRYKSVYTEMKEFPLVTGLNQWSTRLFSGGALPKQIIVGMVETAAFMGSYTKNPMNFKHFGLNSINLKVNGARVPQEPLEPNFSTGQINRAYNHLFMNTGKFKVNRSNCVTDDYFVGGMALFPFDLTPDQCNMFHTHGGREGTLELDLSWSAATTAGITVLVYAAFDQVVSLNGENNHPVVAIF